MAETATFCRHPADEAACRQALVAAWRRKQLHEHCVMEGLREAHPACSKALLEGINTSSPPAGAAATAEDPFLWDWPRACEDALLAGYGASVRAAQDLFLDAYHRLIRYATYRVGISDDGQPSADDVFQEVVLRLHARMGKGLELTQVRLATYVRRVSIRTACELRRAIKPYEPLDVDRPDHGVWPRLSRPDAMSPGLIEEWEDVDQKVQTTRQGDLVNRILLAQRIVGTWMVGSKYPLGQMRDDWQRLARSSDEALEALLAVMAEQIRRFPAVGVVPLAAEQLNEDRAALWQLPALLAAGDGLDVTATRAVLEQLTQLSDGGVFARISRMLTALNKTDSDDPTPETGEEGGTP